MYTFRNIRCDLDYNYGFMKIDTSGMLFLRVNYYKTGRITSMLIFNYNLSAEWVLFFYGLVYGIFRDYGRVIFDAAALARGKTAVKKKKNYNFLLTQSIITGS